MINYLSLFSGIGAFEKAMNNLRIPFNLVGFSEIDKYASKSYSEIHGVPESMNLGDITKIDETKLPKIDFITYGFPCQDISIAGKQYGLLNEGGEKTRSGLFFDALRIIEHTQPVVAIAENVKNLVSKKFNAQFRVVLASLESVGYNNYWAVLNAKDYGVPQNRERVFIVSIRKDCDAGVFEFPKSYSLKLRLKDILESQVDEKFYLPNIQLQKLQLKITDTLDTDKVMQIGNCRPTKNRKNPNQGRIYDINGIAPCLNTKGGGNLEPHIIKPKVIGGIGEKKSNDGQQWYQQDRIYDSDEIAISATTGFNPYYLTPDSEIRKLTPKEYFRLMGFKDEDFEKVERINSNTQLYKQAGNSIVVDVAEELICMLFDEEGEFYI